MNNNTIYLYDDEIGCVEYINHYGDDKMVVNAARVSYGRDNDKPFTKRDETLVKYLMENGHTSPFEHNGATFKFVVPLFVRGQHHRHRTWSYNEISRRYSSVNLRFYEPKSFRMQHPVDHQASNSDAINPEISYGGIDFPADFLMREHNRVSILLYEQMLEKGICREQARAILPQGLYTEYYGTCNLHNLFKFVALRNTEHAQYEIRQVAKALLTFAEELFPISTEAFRKHYKL